MADTVFSRIIRGEIPCHRVYEDEHVLAFLDVNPISRGHTLVIPKEPAATMDRLSDDAAAGLGRALPRVCRAVKKVTGAIAYNLLQNNGAAAHQSVMHVHFHIIPLYPAAEALTEGGGGLTFEWKAGRLDGASGARMADQIAKAIAQG